MVHALKSPKDRYPLLSHGKSFQSGEDLVNSAEKVSNAPYERPESADHAMRLLSLTVFKHLDGFLEYDTL